MKDTMGDVGARGGGVAEVIVQVEGQGANGHFPMMECVGRHGRDIRREKNGGHY